MQAYFSVSVSISWLVSLVLCLYVYFFVCMSSSLFVCLFLCLHFYNEKRRPLIPILMQRKFFMEMENFHFRTDFETNLFLMKTFVFVN